MSAARVIVVGGGLAGLSAAVELASDGHPVTLVEAGPVLGGRTSSRVDEGMVIESGLHRYLGFYVALPRLLQRAGARLEDVVVWEDEAEIVLPDGGPHAVFGTSPVHRPVQTVLSALGQNAFLPWPQKIALVRMLSAGLRDYLAQPQELDAVTVEQYARRHGLDDRTILRVLTPLTEGLFFVPPQEYSAYNFLGLIAPNLRGVEKTRIGAFRGGMSDVLIEPIAEHLRSLGGQILTSCPAEDLTVQDGAVTGVRLADRVLHAEEVVLAAGIGAAQRLVGRALGGHPWFADMLRMQATPSVCLQLELDEPSLPVDRSTFAPGTLLAAFSEQSRTTFPGLRGRLSIILSSPAALLELSVDELVERVVADALRIGIDLRGHITGARKVVVGEDFYSLRCGSEQLRPDQETPVPGLTLAGDYTRQEFLSTMEGAVVSGRRAADAVRRRDGGQASLTAAPVR